MTRPVTMTITISRADAIRAGLTEYGDREVPVDVTALTPEQRDELADMRPAPMPRDVSAPVLRGYDMDAVRAVIDWRIARRRVEAERQARERAEVGPVAREHVKDWLAKSDDERVRYVGWTVEVKEPWAFVKTASMIVGRNTCRDDLPDELAAIVDAERKRLRAISEAAVDARRRAQVAQEQEKKAKDLHAEVMAADWVRSLVDADPTLAARAARGFLPEAERLAKVRSVVFAPFGSMPRYARIDHAEVQSALADLPVYADLNDVEIDAWTADELPAAEFASLLEVEARAAEVRKALPLPAVDVDVEPRVHAATVKGEDRVIIRRFSALVTVRLSPTLTVSREFAL